MAFAADGTRYMSYITLHGLGNVPHAVWVVHSTDGGLTLSAPRRVLGPLAFQVRLATDPARAHRLYLTWLQASSVGLYRFTGPGNAIEVTRSDDGGSSWTRPVRVSDPERGRVVAPVPAVDAHGVLYVLYLDLRDDRLDYEGAHGGFGGPPFAGRFALVLGRSRDGGISWQQSLVTGDVVPTRRFIAFLPPFPSLAIDRRSGTLYVAFEDARLSPSDVYLWSLSSGQSAWRGPTRVNDTPAHDGTFQYLPQLAVAPDGRLDVEYYDRRQDPRNRYTTVSLQSSFDGGRTFTAHLSLTDRAFDSRIGFGSERDLPDPGSRLGLASSSSAAAVNTAGTAALIAAAADRRSAAERAAGGPAFDAAIIANPSRRDAVDAAVLAADRRLPILYVNRDTVPAQTASALKELGITQTIVIGGAGSVGNGVMRALPSPHRAGGGNAYATSRSLLSVSLRWGVPNNQLYVTDGQNPMLTGLLAAPVARIGGLQLIARGGQAGALKIAAASVGRSLTRLIMVK
ncbi:MAG: sialidase family protein [Solirubrobacteraceae bacterium]